MKHRKGTERLATNQKVGSSNLSGRAIHFRHLPRIFSPSDLGPLGPIIKLSPTLLTASRRYSSSWSVCEYLSPVRKVLYPIQSFCKS
jgi:hypothetical protein